MPAAVGLFRGPENGGESLERSRLEQEKGPGYNILWGNRAQGYPADKRQLASSPGSRRQHASDASRAMPHPPSARPSRCLAVCCSISSTSVGWNPTGPGPHHLASSSAEHNAGMGWTGRRSIVAQPGPVQSLPRSGARRLQAITGAGMMYRTDTSSEKKPATSGRPSSGRNANPEKAASLR